MQETATEKVLGTTKEQHDPVSRTLVVNIFGGPGISKSTTSALVFGKLKVRGVNVELVTEFAKDLTWEERRTALRFQPYIAAKQMFHIFRLLGQVDVIVTDSPILLSLVYQGEGYDHNFERFLLGLFRSWRTLNFLLVRNPHEHPYNVKGRNQTEVEAFLVDKQVENMLWEHDIAHSRVEVENGERTADKIANRIAAAL